MECKVNNLKIYYETYGSGTPIIMIHGWGPDHRLMKGCMEPVLQNFDSQFRRIYFDLPGMGKSKRAEWIKGSDQMLDFVINFINKIIPDQNFLIAGESYGGYLARGIINRMHDKIDGLLLICPIAVQETHYENAPELIVFEKDEDFLNTLTKEDRNFFEPMNVIQNKHIWQKFERDILPGLKIADNDFLSNYLGKNVPFSFDVDDLKKPYIKPVLMLTGRQDCVVGYSDLWKIIENYPRATFAVLDKAGHNLQIDQENLFNEMVKEWLNRVILEKK